MTNWKLENRVEKIIENNTRVDRDFELVVKNEQGLRDEIIDLVETMLKRREENLNYTNIGGDYLTLNEFLNHIIR